MAVIRLCWQVGYLNVVYTHLHTNSQIKKKKKRKVVIVVGFINRIIKTNLKVWRDDVNFGCSLLSAAVSADGILLGF